MPEITRVIVNTDDAEIAGGASARREVFERPKELAQTYA